MTTDPITIGPDDSVASARDLLESNAVHHLPVVVDGVLVGILSSSDLLKLHILRERPQALAAIKVSQIMEAEPVTLDVFADLVDVASKLNESSFHALPVVEADDVLVGIVTSTDLINHLLMQIPRGDGSVQEKRAATGSTRISDADLAAAIHAAREAAKGENPDKSSEVILYFCEQNRLLQEVCKAAELYMRSGHAEREHSVLIKSLDEVQKYAPR